MHFPKSDCTWVWKHASRINSSVPSSASPTSVVSCVFIGYCISAPNFRDLATQLYLFCPLGAYGSYSFRLESSSQNSPQLTDSVGKSRKEKQVSSVFSDIIEAVSAKLHLLHHCHLTTPRHTNERSPIHLHRAVCFIQTLHLSNCRQPVEQRGTYLS